MVGYDISKKLLQIQEEIAPSKPKIIAVTKYFDENAIISAYDAGLRDFAESRAVEAREKIDKLPEYVKSDSKFHFIGHLQTNKVKYVVKRFDYIHSVDSVKLAKCISDFAKELGVVQKVLLEVNISGEVQKFGFNPEELKSNFSQILSFDGIRVCGLMSMAPLGETEENIEKLFSEVIQIRNDLGNEFDIKLPEISMGMSQDYKIAAKVGATMLRIGRKLFE